jgi:hypothetical protein
VTDEIYGDLRDAVQQVCLRLDALANGSVRPLNEWQGWARGFCSGLYFRRTAKEALETVVCEAIACRAADGMSVLTCAAVTATEAVVYAIDGDEVRARKLARTARAGLTVPPRAMTA